MFKSYLNFEISVSDIVVLLATSLTQLFHKFSLLVMHMLDFISVRIMLSLKKNNQREVF